MSARRPLGPGFDPEHQDVADVPRRRGRTVAEQAALASAPPTGRPTQTWEERQQDISRVDQVLALLVAEEDGPVVMLGPDYRLPTDRRPLTRRPAPEDQAPSAG